MQSYPHEAETKVCRHFFSWSAIVIGALVSVGLGFLLYLFGMAIGLSAYTTNPEGYKVVAIGGIIGLIIGSIATMFTSGFVAGFLAGPYCFKRNLGVVYGMAAWCLGLILMSLVASSMADYVTGFSNVISTPKVVAAATQVQKTATQINPINQKATAPSTEKDIKTVGAASFIVFVLFFIGAISACVGGCCGFSYWNKWKDKSY